MATNKLGLPPLPEGFVLEETLMPPLPPGFELESPKLETVKVDDLFPKEDQPPKIDDSQPSLRAAPEPTVGKKFKNFIRNIFEDKTETNVKGQMIYQISQDTGRSLRDVEKNYDLLIRDPKITGIQPDPSTMESIETAFSAAIPIAALSNPLTLSLSNSVLSTSLGVAAFMALDEAENAIISAVTDEEYELGGGKNISDLLPEDATRTSKEFVEILDLIGKGMIIGGVRNRTKGAFGRLSEQVTKKYIDEYKLPQDIYMDAGKVRSVLRGGRKDRFSPEEKDLLLDLNLSGSQYRKALSDGVTIRVPAEKVTKLVDRAWWGKVKETFGKPKSSEVVIRERAGELTEAPRGLLTEGRPITQPKVEPPKVKKPKLTQRESQELLDLKANLNTTFERLADPNRTNAQLLQDQRSAQRMIKLIQDKEPEFQAPELPFESDIKDVDASSLRQANIEASERVQHFSDTKAAKERVEDVERISRAEITQFLRNAFDVTIRGKATYKMKGVAGFFSPVTKTVRSAITDDIYVLSHEVAHFIDNKIWGNQPKQRPHFRPWQNELGKLDYDPTKQRTSEGFAEFIRHFVSTGKAKELAPTFYDYFVGDFAKAHPKIYEDILKLRDLMTRYNKQGSVERVKSQINFEGKAPEQPLIKTVQDKSLNFRKQFLDDLAPLEDVYKREKITELSPDKDPLMLMRVFKGKARSKAEMAIRYNTTDYVGRITGKGLVDVIKPVSKTKKELEDFLAYAYARRALSRPDIDAGIELTDAQFVFDKYDSKKFREASDELSGFADRVLEYYVDSRGMSPETRDKIKSLNPVYLPLYRFFSDEPRFRSKASRVSGGKPVKGLKGSGRQILNPIESMIRYVENIYSAADKTRVAIAIKDAVDQGVLPGTLIEKVPPPTDIKKMKLNTLINTLEKEGFGVFNSVDPQTGELFRKQPSGSEMITLFTVGKRYFGKDNIIPIYEGENVSFYELDPRLHEMLQGLDHHQLPPAVDFFLGAPTRIMKLGAVGLNAGFTFITNPIRDLSTYMLFSKSKVPNPAAPMIGLAADLGLGSKAAKDASRRFKAMGGDQATIYGRDRSARYKQMVSRIINEASGTNMSKVKNVVLNPVDALRRIFQTPELAPRIAEMQNKIKDYEKIYGKDSDAAYINAFEDAQDVTINFSKMGTVSQLLNQMIPFFNPTIRGGEKLYREAKENPMRLIVRGVSTITVPALYFWYQNKDKEWYQKLPSELKYSQIHIDTGDFGGSGDIISLPLPHEVGTLFGGIPMAYWDEMYDIDKEGVEEALKLSLRQLNPGTPLDLSVIKPFMLVASNKTWYGAPLETRSMQRKEIPDRYTDYTIPMAKVLSRWMYDNIGAYEFASPVKIEAFANAATGGLTKNINDIVTFSNKEIESKADLPVVGKLFLRKEVYENRPAFDFERFKLLNQKKVSKTITPEQQIELRRLEAEYKQYLRNKKRRELQKEMEQNTP